MGLLTFPCAFLGSLSSKGFIYIGRGAVGELIDVFEGFAT